MGAEAVGAVLTACSTSDPDHHRVLVRSRDEPSGGTALHTAARHNQSAATVVLVNRMTVAEVGWGDRTGRAAAHVAMEAGHEALAEWLLSRARRTQEEDTWWRRPATWLLSILRRVGSVYVVAS